MKAVVILAFATLGLAGAVGKGHGGSGGGRGGPPGKGHGRPHPPKPTPKVCNPMDSCNREILGLGRKPVALETRSADCAEYLKVTVTGAQRTWTETIYTTSGQIATTPAPAPVVTAAPKPVPAYADECRRDDDYASACGCLSVNVTTTTVRAAPAYEYHFGPAENCDEIAVREIPECAHECFNTLTPAWGCTGIRDMECQCGVNFQPIAMAMGECVLERCTQQEYNAVYPAGLNACRCAAASANLPQPTIIL
ncbi:uncharacterized protein PODANS_1_23370 [Podospora anserina S mat+]|uniref:Podospora anserina S mat+ genomic DNA chromosome 1, supercontig 6 n=1 Tax=Podospora anserina (strain S / ATCC MYA-4624 / DSM 980 / FGSC 10383) TaxID=515849 RepID=B2ASG0_PODAN|nr:uncharacterized protein PODANS_1_23370 [Podospora anserina S mat+]CAP67333.1 unnamed protein product [Podospora anserina S mat+]CDP24745.1 Putative protein of unknown function [Podospora anserina S mat+]